MVKCSKCGISEEEERLYDAVTDEGIVKICKNCALSESVPIIRTVKKSVEKDKSVYDRLSNMAGIDPEEHKRKFVEKNFQLNREETSLREIVERNFNRQVEKTSRDYPQLKEIVAEKKDDLVEHYNWRILRARRARKITYIELAREISEPEPVIRLAERGILPKDYAELIRKLETCLGIDLFKVKKVEKKEVSFDPATTKNLTISDLQEIGEKENKSFFPYWKEKLGFGKRKEENIELNTEDFDFEEDVKIKTDEAEEDETILEDIEKYEEAKQVKEDIKKNPKRDLTREEIDKIFYDK